MTFPVVSHRALAARFIGAFIGAVASMAVVDRATAAPVEAATEQQPAAAATEPLPASESQAPAVPLSDAAPSVAAAYARLTDKAFTSRYAKADVEAAAAFYGARKDPLWVGASGLNDRAKALATEMAKAAEWGLDAKVFPLPDTAATLTTPEALGGAEAQVTLAALTYARHAKGGRVRPLSISQLLDLNPPVRDPKTVLSELEGASDPAGYLTGLHPRHEQFRRLRAELLKRMGPVEPATPVDEALLVKLPVNGATVKPGSLHPDISLLRKRLKMPAEFAGRDTLYDDKLAEAIKAFQTAKGLKANGQLTRRTRAALNKEGEGDRRDDSPRDTQRLIVNMERWRWMPENLGASYVINNIPEYITRTYADGDLVFKEKIIVGLPNWPTPSFSAEMKTIVFNPSWGVPEGIKAKELKPRLQRAGGNGFFDQLFGGGGASVLRAYGFTPYRNGRPVDPNSVDWSSADLRQYSFIQPPGGQNPLGFVKFMFPNSHDVYMHDTIQRNLFAQSRRPFSHGCIRVNDPGRFAQVLLNQDKGWGPERVAAARRGSETVELNNHIWVHNVYLTAWVDDEGTAAAFGDVYGLDSRVSHALGGGTIASVASPVDVETASIDEAPSMSGVTGAAGPKPKKAGNKKNAKPAKQVTMPGSFSEAMSGLLAN